MDDNVRKVKKVIITKRSNDGCNDGITFNDIMASSLQMSSLSIKDNFIRPKDYNLDNLIKKYIDDRTNLIDIIKKEAPTNTELQSDIIDSYNKLFKLNITSILEDDKKEHEEYEEYEESIYSDSDSNSGENLSDYFSDGESECESEIEIEKKNGKLYVPMGGKNMTVFIDDMSMPFVNAWGD
jgi:hypothetical protein